MALLSTKPKVQIAELFQFEFAHSTAGHNERGISAIFRLFTFYTINVLLERLKVRMASARTKTSNKGVQLDTKESRDRSAQTNTSVVQDNQSRLGAVVNSLVRNTVETQDLVHDVFVEYFESADLGVVIENVGAWLVTVAKNKVFDRFRRHRTSSDYEARIQATEPERLISAEPDPEAMAWSSELRDRLQEAMMLLPEDQRDIFIQNEIEGKTFEEISKATGVALNTLLSRKRYAVLFLKEYLQEVYDELD